MSEGRAGSKVLSLTFIRCSTVLLEFDGYRILTDPWFGMHMRGLPVFRRPGLGVAALGGLDAVLASHLHPDHYDRKALSRMNPAPGRVILPPGGLAALGSHSSGTEEELAPWSNTTIGKIEVTAVPGPHTLPGPEEVNFVLSFPGWGRVFFGGDARFDGPVLTRVAREFAPFRLALLPVGGTRILGHKTVMDPRDAERAADLLDAGLIIPIHEGWTWMPVPPLSIHPGRARHLARRFARRGCPERVAILTEGKSLHLAGCQDDS